MSTPTIVSGQAAVMRRFPGNAVDPLAKLLFTDEGFHGLLRMWEKAIVDDLSARQ